MADLQPASHTAKPTDTSSSILTEAVNQTTQAVSRRTWRRAGRHARLLHEQAELLRLTVVRDAIDAGLDWWHIGDDLSMHPQDAWELYRSVAEGLPSPADQRPDLALRLCAGVDALHDFHTAYGADLDDLPTSHSLHHDPTVSRLREASVLLRADIWIAVHLPGGADSGISPGSVAVTWPTVASDSAEIAHVRQALAVSRSPTHCCVTNSMR